MNFIDGVILIRALTEITFAGIIITVLIMAAGAAIEIGALSLYKHSIHEFNSDFKRVVSYLIFIVGISVMMLGSQITSIEQLNLTEPNGQYKVVVTDAVDMEEFQSKYEIINYKDNTYTISIKQEE